MRFIKIKALATLNGHLVDYPTPVVGYFSSFGSLSGLCLLIQIVTGILLTAHYTPHIIFAFSSVEHIIRDVNDGWLFRYYHSNGASIFFVCVYLHVVNNFSSEADDILWLSGFVLYLLVIATAFMGYILPWGQISFWGATVITNLFAAIPLVGNEVSQWLWGGFSVDNPTLNRFFSFHYILPFVIAAVVIVHLTLLHIDESSSEEEETVEFYYYYFVKDVFILGFILCIFTFLVFFSPNYLSHPDNYTIASVSVTPAHLVPEWYFLPFYAALRSTPDKFGGLLLIFLVLSDFFILDGIEDETSNFFNFVSTGDDIELLIDEDDEVGSLLIIFFLGGSDIDEPFSDLTSILVILQFIDYFDLPLEQTESPNSDT